MNLSNTLKGLLIRLKSYLSKILTRGFYSYRSIKYNIERGFFILLCFPYELNLLKPLIRKALVYFGFEIRKIIDIENYSKLYPDSVEFIYKKKNKLYFSNPIYLNDKVVLKGLQKTEGTNYYAIVKSSGVIGGSNLILLENDNVLYDIAFSNNKNNYKYIDGAIKLYLGNLFLIYSTKSTITLENGILVSGNFSWNYYHLLYEIIAKFKAIDEAEIDPEIPLLVDKICQEVPQYLELFSIFNKRDRKIILLDFRKRYTVDKLFYFSSPNFLPPHFVNDIEIKPNDCLFDLSVLDFLRSNLLPVAANRNLPNRIFISRRRASNSRRYNEDEVFYILEKYGFIKIEPENYSITEQVTLFNQADFIAGGTGAAFTNLLFCRESCKVICFTNYKFPISIFSTISSFVGCDMTYIYDDTKTYGNKNRLHDSFYINTDNLNMFLPKWLIKNSNR